MIVIVNSLRVCAAVALELRFDPIDRLAVTVRALPAVAKFGEPADGGLIACQFKARDHCFDLFVGGIGRGLSRGCGFVLSEYAAGGEKGKQWQ